MRALWYPFVRPALLVSLLSVACHGAAWKSYHKSSEYRVPDVVKVVIYARESKRSREHALVAARRLGDTLKRALEDGGIEASVVHGALEPPAPPRVELRIQSYNADSRALRGLIGGAEQLIVECVAYLPGSRDPVFRGIVRGTAGDYATREDAIDDAAHAIAAELMTTARRE